MKLVDLIQFQNCVVYRQLARCRRWPLTRWHQCPSTLSKERSC